MTARGPFDGIRRFVSRPTPTERSVRQGVDDEVAFHLDMRERELRAAGLDAAAARRAARAAFGDIEGARAALLAEDLPAAARRRRTQWLDELQQDIRWSLRQMRRHPGLALLIVIIMALGTGASAAMVTVANSVLWRDLPFAEPDRLVRVLRDARGARRESGSVPDFNEFRRESKTVTALTSYVRAMATLSGAGVPRRLHTAQVSANFFGTLGVRPVLGRDFTDADDLFGAPRVVLLAEGMWRAEFGSDPAVVGRTLRLDGREHTIVGVMPERARFPAEALLWTPAQYDPEISSDKNRGASFIRMVGRLAPGASLGEARVEFGRLAASIAERFEERRGTGVIVEEMSAAMVREVREPLQILLGAVLLVLLLACSNVAGLLLGRATAREGELVLRTALGAGRGRIARQLLTESVMLGCLAALAGTLVARGLLVALPQLMPELPRLAEIRFDAGALVTCLAIGLVTGVLFGLAPAWRAARRDVAARLRGGARGVATGRGGVRAMLVTGQLAAALMLLTGAGLLLRSFAHLQRVDTGFATDSVLTFAVSLPPRGASGFGEAYGGIEGQRQFLRAALDRLQAMPGVDKVGASFALPLTRNAFELTFQVEGKPPAVAGEEPASSFRLASPDYFDVMGMRILRGRGITAEDRAGAPMAIVVTDAFARAYFPGGDVLGQRLSFGWERDSLFLAGEVVGVVNDVAQVGLAEPPGPIAYFAADQWPMDEYAFVLRSGLPSAAVSQSATRAIRSIDPELALHEVQTTAALRSAAMAAPRLYVWLLSGFGVMGLLVAVLGTYGLVAFGVQQRTREIGVRMALGASVGAIRRMIVRDGMRLVVVGMVVGVAGALALGGLLRSVLVGVHGRDPVTLLLASGLLAASALAACLIPAIKASRVDPQGAIRAE